MNLFLSTWGLIILAAIMDVIGAFVVKIKINELGTANLSSFSNILSYLLDLSKYSSVWFGAILILTAPIPYALALSRMQLSTTYPIIVGINALFLFPLAVIYLNEAITINKLVGFFIIIIGLYFLK